MFKNENKLKILSQFLLNKRNLITPKNVSKRYREY